MRNESLVALAFAVLLFCGLAWILDGNDAARRAVFGAGGSRAPRLAPQPPADSPPAGRRG